MLAFKENATEIWERVIAANALKNKARVALRRVHAASHWGWLLPQRLAQIAQQV